MASALDPFGGSLIYKSALDICSVLGTNQINGTIPDSMANLTLLNTLCVHAPVSLPTVALTPEITLMGGCSDLSNNQLTGTVPSLMVISIRNLAILCVPLADPRAYADSSSSSGAECLIITLAYAFPVAPLPEDG
jgi:hypothetical protein